MRIAALLVWFAVLLTAADPPTEPILRIETGFHSAMIKRVDATADGSIIMTASSDKTLRLWRRDGDGFAAEAVYRVPLGPGNEGKLSACAISPDGRWLAAAGWTGWDWDGTSSIYLIDRSTGSMVKRITGLPNLVMRLRIDADGKRLLACLAGTEGVRCFALPEGTELWRDTGYANQTYGGCWLPDGGAATASLDGKVRRYGRDGGKLAETSTGVGQAPYDIAYHDGMLVVGHEETTVAARLDAKTLEVLGKLQLGPLGNFTMIGATGSLKVVPRKGELSSVCAAAGRWWAGGTWGESDKSLVSWPAGGGSHRQHAGAASTVTDLRGLPDGVVMGSADPGLCQYDATGAVVASRLSDTCDLRTALLRVDPTGRQCWFGRKPSGVDPVLLDLVAGTYDIQDQAPDACLAPVHEAPGITVTGWDSTKPSINGVAITLKTYEPARSRAVPPEGGMVILGCEWSLRAFGPDGKERWIMAVPGAVWDVHCPLKAPVVVAAYGDGTLRWHRLTDGTELLACFVHRDGRRWVAWTPSGYYWAGPGSEDLLGWHLNRGKDQLADFYPASRFRAKYNRPDVVQAMLSTWDEEKAIAMAGRRRLVDTLSLVTALPPVVELLSPVDGATLTAAQVRLEFKVRTAASAPVTGLRVLFNGQELAVERGMKPKPVAVTAGAATAVSALDVTVPAQSGVLSVIAENRHGVSVPATRSVIWAGAAALTRPVCYVLAVGVGAYHHADIATLQFPGADARAVAAAFTQQQGRLFREVRTEVVVDGDRRAVMKGLGWLKRNCTNQDLAVLFLAGHGENDDQGAYHFLPADTEPDDLATSAVPFTAILATIAALPGKRLAFLDTCRAGNVTGGLRRRAAGNASDQALNQLASAENGCVVFAAATGRQAALEREAWGHGAFTLALTEALTGVAPSDATPLLKLILAEPTLSVNLLNTYLAERVKQLTGGQQSPTMERPATVPDFPVALRR